MITSKDVMGPEQDPTFTKHVYASLLDTKGKQVVVCLVDPEDKKTFEVQGRTFERSKERDEHSRIVFKETSPSSKK